MARRRLSNVELADLIAETAWMEAGRSQSANQGWGAVEPGYATEGRIRRRVQEILDKHRPQRKTRVGGQLTQPEEE